MPTLKQAKMGMLILLFLTAFFGFPTFLLSLDKAYVTEPFLLTGGNIGKVSVPYFAFDQCKPYHSITHDPKVESRNFGLYFMMKHRGGHCDEGILICYPGTLMRNHMIDEFKKMSDFRLKRTFQVGNKENDSLSLECAKKAEQFVGISNPKQWRGIKVYTKLTNSSNPLSARELILETSLTNRTYTFEPMTRQLSLNFGTRVSMFTWVTTHFGQPFHDEEFDLAEQYAKQMGYGSFLEQHVGLWLLGMDMLPWMAEEFVSLYVYRSCSCTMDAWFTRPTDENDPIEPIVPSAGSSQCPTKKMDETFELGQLDAQHLQADLVFTVLTDEKWQNFTVEFLSGGSDLTAANSTDNNATVVMTMTIATTDDMEVSFPGMGTTVVNGTQMPNGTQQLRFDIFLLKHWYAMMVNGVQFGDVFWPNEWWHGAAWKNLTAIRLNGQVLLLYGPELDDYRIENENFNASVPLPFSQKIDGFRKHSTFFFRVQLLNETHNTVNITFTDGKSNNLTGHAEFTIEIENFEIIALTASYDIGSNKTHNVDRNTTTIQPTNSNVFELLFNFTEHYVILFNGERILPNYTDDMPLCEIEYVKVIGDAILLDSPKLHVPPPIVKKGDQIIVALEDPLNYGDLIVISNYKQKPSEKITVKLWHSSPECNKKSDLIAEMEFKVDAGDDGKEFFCEHKLSFEESCQKGPIQNDSLKISSKKPLSLQILMAKNSFYGRISFHDDVYIKLCPYHLTRKATPTPPWRIDHIQVRVPEATLTVNDIRVEQADPSDANETVWNHFTLQMESKRIEWTRVKYLKINQTLSRTGTFYVIVNVPLAKQLNASAWMRFNLLNDALEVDNIFGTTVNQIYLYAGKWLSFGLREPDTKAWRTIVNYTLGTMVQEEHSDTVTPNSVKQFELKFIIALNSAASNKIGVELQINGQHITNDIHGALLTCCPAAEAVQIEDIQYITPESSGIEMLTDTDVEMNCIPADKCIFKT